MISTYLPRHIEVGKNSLEKLGKIALKRGGKRLYVIIDAFLVSEMGYDKKIKEIVKSEQLEVSFFSDYRGEPTVEHVNQALAQLNSYEADCVVAIGGGSAIDIAKAVSFFGMNPHMPWEEITSQGKLTRFPLIAVPTTAGTGSEATKVMVVTDTDTQVKMNPGHQDLIPDIAILDPKLTTSLPKHFTAYTGMDALTHAIEAYVSTRANKMTDHFALAAIEMIGEALPVVYEDVKNVEAREKLLLASCYAGVAFSNSSTNLAHAVGRSLGTRFHIPHGLSVALMLPFVLRFTKSVTEERLTAIGKRLGLHLAGEMDSCAEQTIAQIEKMNEDLNIWQDGATYIDLDDLQRNITVFVNDALSGNGIETNRLIPKEEDIESLLLSLIHKLKQLDGKKVR